MLKLHNYDADRNALGYLVCDINSAALTSIMAKYVDVEQVCLWLQPLNDRVIAMTGEASHTGNSFRRILCFLTAFCRNRSSLTPLIFCSTIFIHLFPFLLKTAA